MNEVTTHEQHIVDQSDALKFIVGGNATFTLVSQKTGTRFTYKVIQNHKDENLFKVSVMNGKDNTRNYKEFGSIRIENFMAKFTPLNFAKEMPHCIAFGHVILNLSIGMVMPALEIWHSGRCCRCGRLLTVPESIAAGIGPECIHKKSILSYEY